MTWRIPMLCPQLGGNDQRYLMECLDSGWVSSGGPHVLQFEQKFARYVGTENAVACSSGTAALHLCLTELGVGPGDEVLVSDLTFMASANPVRYCGGIPVLVDSEIRTWNLDPALIITELKRRASFGEKMPVAIIAVHLLGYPADIESLYDSCMHYGIPLVEDAAEALGAKYTEGKLTGRSVGTVGQLGFFSFNGNKVLTTGGGGMVVTADRAVAERIRHLSTQARLPGPAYVHDRIGYNYRLSNLGAALGLAQLEMLPQFLKKKQQIAAHYDSIFINIPNISRPPGHETVERSSWLYTILLKTSSERNSVSAALNGHGIETRPMWIPLHQQPPYRGAPILGTGKVADDLAARGLGLPSSTTLIPSEIEEITEIVVETINTLG